MNLLYSGDRNTRLGVLMSVLSIMENTKEKLNVYILTASFEYSGMTLCGIESEFARYLDFILKKENAESSATLIDMSSQFLSEFPEMNKDTRFTASCMLRLFADKADLPDKLLYLDYDVICTKDVSKFYNTDLSGFELAGVLDYYGRFCYDPSYLNSGVLLLNMAEIKKTGLFAKCRKLCIEKKMLLPDQTALNRLTERKLILPRRYNDQRKTHCDTVLRHFSTTFRFFPLVRKVSVKPWDKERMHRLLKDFDCDVIADKALTLFKNYQGEYYENSSHILCG